MLNIPRDPTLNNRSDDIVPGEGRNNFRTVTLHIGDLHASKEPARIKTILGSCIAACLFDPSTGIGGMNHFLLPGNLADPDISTRYGVNAMEVLINEMMKLGAQRQTLKAKIFGGGDIFHADHSSMMVGAKNIRFVRNFLETESIPVMNSRLGGNNGLMIVYHSHTFEVFVKPLSSQRFHLTGKQESTYQRKLTHELSNTPSDNITLF
jgi:chemotaxis receptor (MCP) glutamine deamidase CheD